MKLHANAALSLKQRERMVLRVLEHGWPIAKAAEAAEVSDRTCSKVGQRYRQWARPACLIVARRRPWSPTAPPKTRSRCWQRCAGCASLPPELADLLDLPAST